MVSFLYITPQYIVSDVLLVLDTIQIFGNPPHGMHLTYICILPPGIN